ncbi:MAG: protein kinase [Planctomycetes bacterium]|nr:protein kinase [Planctomycetota bacterium]
MPLGARFQCKACGQTFVIRTPLPGATYRCQKCDSPDPLTALAGPPPVPAPPATLLAPPMDDDESLKLMPVDSISATEVPASPGPGALKNLLPPVFDGYRIARELARGGMGAVLLAEQMELRRRVALKVMLPGAAEADPSASARFAREARAMAKLKHPHIISVYGVGAVHGMPYFAMEYVEGWTLAKLIADKKLGFTQLTEIVAKVARALAYAHGMGVIHRDLKPANIMVRFNGEPVLMDLGLAKDTGTQSVKLSMTGNIMGTPAYMSPEQAQGQSVDERSDIYSLGAVLYEALVQRPPFEGNTVAATIFKIVHDDPRPPREIDAGIPEALARVTTKALEKNPKDRYATMDDFASDLDRFREGMDVSAAAPSLGRRASKWIAAHKPAAAGAATAAALAVVLVLALAFGWLSTKEDRAAALRSALQTDSAAACAAHLQACAADLKAGRIKRDEPAGQALLAVIRETAGSEDPTIAVAAIEALATAGDEESAPALEPNLKPERPAEVRRAAVAALGKLHPPQTQRLLIEVIQHDPDTPIRLAAIQNFGEKTPPDRLIELIRLATKLEPPVVAEALSKKLAELRPSTSILSLFTGGNSAAAANAMGELMESMKSYEQQLEESEAALNGNAGAGKKEPFDKIVERLAKGEPPQRVQAAYDLGALKDARAEAPLVAALADAESDVARVAADALAKIGALKAPEKIIPLLKSPREGTRLAAARACGLVRPKPDAAPLVDALAVEKSAPVQAELSEALGRLRAANAAAVLRAVLADGGRAARAKAAWALGRAGTLADAEALVRALEDAGQDDVLKEACAGSLAELTGKALGTDPKAWRNSLKSKK